MAPTKAPRLPGIGRSRPEPDRSVRHPGHLRYRRCGPRQARRDNAVFEVASAQEAQVAAKAIDPKDESVHPSMVTMPDDKGRSRDEAAKAVKDRAKATQDKADAGLAGTRTTPAQAEAAKSTKSDKDGDK